ncbi:hypothetical protein J6590_034603 [Homalodisca vitripennis]|nr:hypothetical protein J6590_034603 [Homalodisca vitripennis]
MGVRPLSHAKLLSLVDTTTMLLAPDHNRPLVSHHNNALPPLRPSVVGALVIGFPPLVQVYHVVIETHFSKVQRSIAEKEGRSRASPDDNAEFALECRRPLTMEGGAGGVLSSPPPVYCYPSQYLTTASTMYLYPDLRASSVRCADTSVFSSLQ